MVVDSTGVKVFGDTGVTAEQKTVVRGQYGAEVVVMNIGDTYTTGPAEAAYVLDELIQPGAALCRYRQP